MSGLKRAAEDDSTNACKKLKPDERAIVERSVATIRVVSAEQPCRAKSGHPGAPMGLAPVAYALWTRVMNYSPRNPQWFNRDRFILSNGHASALQYTMLHLAGYDVSIDDLKNFRQMNSKTPGHPEVGDTPGVEVTTGPLGQGFANGVGMAMAVEHLRATFNTESVELIDNDIYVICGDGCMEEGISSEAASLAGHLGLGRLFVLYDDNKITIDGPTDLSFSEDVCARFEAYGWYTAKVDGTSPDALVTIDAVVAALDAARTVRDRAHFIAVSTVIGYGSKWAGTEEVHGTPLKPDDLKSVKSLFGFDPEQFFHVPDEVRDHFRHFREAGERKEDAWNAKLAEYTRAHPDKAAELQRRLSKTLPEGWLARLPTYAPSGAADATRNLSGKVLDVLAPIMPELVGGSADLTPSNKTKFKGSTDFSLKNRAARYFRFGVREHGMFAILNGMTAYGALIPFGGTFLNFIEYGLGAVRLSAVSHFRVLYVMTHDSIGLGEDGPTHQPIEAVNAVRAMPNILLLRPADGNEVSGAYAVALSEVHRPSVMCLSRQNVPQLPNTSIDGVRHGGYVIQGADAADVILVSSGTEVSIIHAAAALLTGVKVRVVSMPCTELFDEQPKAYQLSVLGGAPVLSVEAASVLGWERYAHAHIGMTTFGKSAPYEHCYEHFGFTPANVAAKARQLMEFYRGKDVHCPMDRPF